MNISEFTETAINHPEKRATASRFRLSGRTIWVKVDPKDKNEKMDFRPILSHMGSFLVSWPYSAWGMGMAPRTHNLMDDVRATVRKAWAWDLANDHGSPKAEAYHTGSRVLCRVEYPEDDIPINPVPMICMDSREIDASKLKVKVPSEVAVSMLLLGKHPEDNVTLRDWFTGLTKNPNDSEEKAAERDQWLPANHINLSFENTLRSLAYGAIKRENSMKVMASSIGQMKSSLDTQSNSMITAVKEQADRHFAPSSMQVAGLLHTEQDKLAGMMKELSRLAGSIAQTSNVFEKVISSPGSGIPLVDIADNWYFDWKSKVGVIETNHYQREEQDSLCVEFDSDAQPTFHLELTKGMVLRDANPRSFSYYWVRRNFYGYREVLSKLGLYLEYPQGESPAEWKYEALATPYFLEESGD